MAKIDENEWLQELARLSARKYSGRTTAEWSEVMGCSQAKTMKALKQAKALGWLVLGKQSRVGFDGRAYTAIVYSIVRPKGVKR